MLLKIGTDIFLHVHEHLTFPYHLLLLLGFMAVAIPKCCIRYICWTVPNPIYSGIDIACVESCKLEMLLNIDA